MVDSTGLSIVGEGEWLNGVLLPFPIIVSSLHFIPVWVTRKRTPA